MKGSQEEFEGLINLFASLSLADSSNNDFPVLLLPSASSDSRENGSVVEAQVWNEVACNASSRVVSKVKNTLQYVLKE